MDNPDATHDTPPVATVEQPADSNPAPVADPDDCPVTTEGEAVDRLVAIIRHKDSELSDAIEASNHHRRMIIYILGGVYLGIIAGYLLARCLRKHREDTIGCDRYGHPPYPVEQ